MTHKTYKLKTDNNPVELTIDYKAELNTEQLSVVEHGDGACLVLAGAGSGKTRTLVYRVAYLLEHGVHPENILLMTFTNRAANEMIMRVEELLTYHPKGLWAGTFHHVGNRILRKYITQLGFTSNFTILDTQDAQDVLKNIIGDITTTDKYFPKAKALQNIISYSRNAGTSIEATVLQRFTHLNPELIDMIAVIANRYTNKKQELNLLDYDDLLILWLKLMNEHETVSTRIRSQFQYILVDEYQDTNHIQAELIKSITKEHNNIMVVGDDAQSIYSFRAAQIENILSFPEHFPDCSTFKLETNYRSTPDILALANNSIDHNSKQFKKNLKSIKPAKDKPVLAALGNTQQQAEFITQRILELHDEGTSLNDIAVLFRADYHALELELQLNKKAIPYIKRGGLRFFEQAHLKDVVAFLRILNNPKDEISWTRLLLLLPGIGRVTALKIIAQITTAATLADVITMPITGSKKVAASWNDLVTILKPIAQKPELTISDYIEAFIRGLYDDYVKSAFENPQKRIEDIEQLTNFADQYSSLDELLADITLSEGFQTNTTVPDTQQDEQVILSTIHQAKGLEWDTVFVMHLASGQFPHQRAMQSRAEVEEERRLFYVACTRAQQALYLLYPITLYSHSGGLAFTQPSEFIRELDTDLYDEWNVETESTDDLPTIEYLP